MAQRLRPPPLPMLGGGGTSLIPGWEAKIPRDAWAKNQKLKQKQYFNKFNKDFKYGPHLRKIKYKQKPSKASSPSYMFIVCIS